MCPHVGAVIGNEDGDIADDADTTAVGIGLQFEPLFEEQELLEFVQFDLVGQLLRPLFHGPNLPFGDCLGPGVPDAAVLLLMIFLQSHEEREIIKPIGGVLAEPIIGFALKFVAVGQEVFMRQAHERSLVLDDRPEIDLAHREVGHNLNRFGRQIAVGHQTVGADEQRVSGKCRKTLIG